MLPKKIFLNVSSDSTSWQITLAKSLSSLRSQLAPCLLESVSASEKQGTSSEPFPKGALAILLFTKLSPIPPNFTNRKQRETNNERCSPCHRHVTILLSIYGAPLLTQGGGQNGSWFYHYWSVYLLSLVVFILRSLVSLKKAILFSETLYSPCSCFYVFTLFSFNTSHFLFF